MQNLKTAIVFGASGLIGGYLTKALSAHPSYSRIVVITRRPLQLNLPRVQEVITDFKSREELQKVLQGDEIFCCLGTTISKAGSQEAFRKVDYQLPLLIGETAAQNKIPKMLVVSSLGADALSGNFYLRTKGEMERDLKMLHIPVIKFFRPSMLLGPRNESRPGETIGKIVMMATAWLFIGKLRKYKAIHAETVAEAMIVVANSSHTETIFESDAIAALTK